MKLGLALALVTALQAPASESLTPAYANAFEKKLAVIVLQSASARQPSKPRRTVLPQVELNSYLRFKGPEVLPQGVTDASMQVAGEGRLAARAIVDLDVLRRRSSGSWLDPKTYLTGRLPLTMTGTLTSSGGIARFTIEQADVSGVPVPPTLVHELVAYYSRSEEYPQGVDLVRGFQLPAAIDRIDVEAGRMVVVQ